jgi:creatinine amidohydrolase
MQTKFKYEEMLPSEFQEAVSNKPLFLVPAGLLEWHGDHLPLGTDGLKAQGLCLEIANKMQCGIVLPYIYFGRPGYSRRVGTMTFSEGCLMTLFTELFFQLKKMGAKVIVVLSGHYGDCQIDFVKLAARNFTTENPDVRIIALPEYEGVTVDGIVPADHAKRWETSLMMHYRPDLVHIENFKNGYQEITCYENVPNDYYKESDNWAPEQDLKTLANKEIGEKAANIIVDNIIMRIEKEFESGIEDIK